MTDYLDFGTPISFALTTQYLDHKTATRREWKDSHAAKFCNAFDRAAAAGQQLRVPAIDKAYHAGGKQIGWCVIVRRPYQQQLGSMSEEDLMAEGGMNFYVIQFIRAYFYRKDFEAALLLKVWVVCFEFIPLSGIELNFVPVKDREYYQEQVKRFRYVQKRELAGNPCSSASTNPGLSVAEIEAIQGGQEPIQIQGGQEPIQIQGGQEPIQIQGGQEPERLPWTPDPRLKVFGSCKTDEHNTPEFLTDAARLIMGGIDLDPMSNVIANRTVRAHRVFTKDDDGLTKPWLGRVWLNPPFSLADRAVEKLIAGYESGDVFEAILLIKSAPDTKRHQSLYPYPFCDLNGRLKFEAEGNRQSAPFATVLFYLGPNFPRFRQIMSAHGRVHLGQRLAQELESDRLRLRNEIEILKNGTKLDLSTILKHCDKCGGRGCGECDFGWSRATDWDELTRLFELSFDYRREGGAA